MNTIIRKAIQVIAVTGLLAGGQAMADDIVCASTQGLRDVLNSIDFVNQKDREGLFAKTMEADDKYAQDKLCDAAYKLDDYAFKVGQLTSGTKAKAEDIHPGALQCAYDGASALSAEWKSQVDGGCQREDPPRGPKN